MFWNCFPPQAKENYMKCTAHYKGGGVPYVIFVLFLVFVNLCQNKNLQGNHFYVYQEERLDI